MPTQNTANPKPETTLSKRAFTRAVNRLQKQIEAMGKQADRRAREAYAAGFEDGNDEPALTDAGGRLIGRGYRTVRFSIRDETSTSQEAAIQRAYRQWASNPLAKSIIDLRTEYVWSDGPTVSALSPAVQEIIDTHWYDSVNDWPGKGANRVRDLGLYGELIVETFERHDPFTGSGDGRVRLGAVDPSELAEIITDADNREEIIAIRLKNIGGDTGRAGRLLKVITRDEDDQLCGVKRESLATDRAFAAGVVYRDGWRVIETNEAGSSVRVTETCSGKAWRVFGNEQGRIVESEPVEINGQPYDGQCFYWRVNTTSIGLRGRPDILPLIDWLDRYDQMFFDILEHAALMKDIVWDMLVTGADDKEIDKRVRDFIASAAKSGKVYGHNEKITLTPQNPDLKGADWASLSDTILNLIAGGARLPVYMLGSGGDANLATATAQGSPTFKGFETRQGVVKRILETILEYVIDCAVEAGTLAKKVQMLDENGQPVKNDLGLDELIDADDAFTVTMPEISTRDAAAAANIFAALVNAVTTAVTAQLMPKRTAIEIIAHGAELVGVEIDIEKVMDELSGGAAEGTQPLADMIDAAKQADATAATQPSAQPIDRQFTGIQIQAINQIIASVNAGQATQEQGINQLTVLFGLSEYEAKRLLGIDQGSAVQPSGIEDEVGKLLATINEGAVTEPKGNGTAE